MAEIKHNKNGIPIADIIPLKGIKRQIAENMLKSHFSTAPASILSEFDVTDLVLFRNDLAGHPEKTEGLKISYTHLIIKAISQALRENLILNSTLAENEIQVLEDINIGMAVALQDGNLIVPVIHEVDKKNIIEITRIAMDLATRAQIGKLTLADVQKGTFTLSNIGAIPTTRFGSMLINQQQCAVVGTGAIREAPAVKDGQIVIRWLMTAFINYDHRIVSGIPVANFMHNFGQILAEPFRLELGI